MSAPNIFWFESIASRHKGRGLRKKQWLMPTSVARLGRFVPLSTAPVLNSCAKVGCLMTPERWKKLKDLCHLALEREPEERGSFLAKACLGDVDLLRDAESMIARATSGGGILDGPIWKDFPFEAETREVIAQAAQREEESLAARATPGAGTPTGPLWRELPVELEATVIGNYHLLQKIGEGGMGEVWLAEQKEPVRRRVALKLVKVGMNTREVIGRFESERQALALMEHPAIAKVLDAGSTPDGAPYFAMEYVAGVPITEYCDNHRLPIRERLDLFMQVCEGVRHAHQKAVIHRDLKPSNILVEDLDGRPVPKIIDFGVAKALGQKLTTHTMFTRVGSLVGTPEYMSPEQALSSGEDVDTRMDVYSLGIIFYELLVGAPPIELRKLAFDEYLRRLREEDPPKPSTKIRTRDAATTTKLARQRKTELATLIKQIGGDLDSIALKALEKDRSRRYGSAADFAADIARYLRHEAVLAVPPSVAYRTRKFASRHRWGVAMACAFVVVLTAAAGISMRQSKRANREAAIAAAVSDFLQNDLLAQASASTQASPSTKPDPDLKVRTALDRAAAKIGGKFDQQPEVEAAIRATIGQTYLDLGLYSEARTQFERALELRRRVLGTKDPKTLQSISSLGTAFLKLGKFPEAEALLSQALAGQRRVLGPEHADTLRSMFDLAVVSEKEGKPPQAEALFNQLLESRRRVLGPEHPDTLRSVNGLATVYSDEGKFPQAEALYSQVLEIDRRVLGTDHPQTLICTNNLAVVYFREGKYPQAEALQSQTLEIQRRVLGPEHPDTLMSRNNLALTYKEQGKYTLGEALYRENVEIARRVLGPDHPITLGSMTNLADVYNSQGKYEQAEVLGSQTLGIQRRVLGLEHPDTLVTMNILADAYSFQDKYAQAERLFGKTLEISRRTLGDDHPLTLALLADFASMYQRQRKYALAEAQAAQVLTGRRHALGSEHRDTMASAADLALAYVSQGKFAEAEPLAREALETEKKVQPNDWQQYRAASLLGISLAGEKEYGKAEPLLLEGYQGMLARKDRIDVPDHYHLDLAHRWLVQLYQAWGKPDQAAHWRKQ
jgi:eukaryotic-like serine/threonine-protein kinase